MIGMETCPMEATRRITGITGNGPESFPLTTRYALQEVFWMKAWEYIIAETILENSREKKRRKRAQQEAKNTIFKTNKTYEQYLQENGGVDPHPLVHQKSIENITRIMREGEPREVDKATKCCATCEFWDGQRSLNPTKNVHISNGRVSGNCTNPQRQRWERRGWQKLWNSGCQKYGDDCYKKWAQL